MGGGIVMLLVGFLAGGVAASVVWAVAVSGRRRAVEAQKAEREQVMASVGETLAEADAIETNFRSGALTSESFRRHLGDRVNAVMRLLRTNMHILDAYFVKYAEQEARDYLRVIDNPERRGREGPEFAAPVLDADSGMELPDPPETNLFTIAPAAAPLPPVAAAPINDAFPPLPAKGPINEAFPPPVARAPSVIDTDDRYEPPFAAPAPTPPPAVGVVDAFDEFEPQPAAPAPDVADTAGRYELPPAAPAPSAADMAGRYESLPPAAPAPTPTAGIVDTVDEFEPPPAAPAPSIVDTANRYEPPFAAPGVIDTVDEFEPPPAAPVPPPPAAVREEELVLGESPDDRNAALAYGPVPAPASGDSFEISAPPAPAAPPPPAAQGTGDAAWTGSESIEEFEAAFAQFEIPASQVHATEYEETGRFPMGDVVSGPRTPIPAPQTPPPQQWPTTPAAEPDRQDDDYDHEFIETSSIDRGAILSAMAAAGQAIPPVQTPLSPLQPPIQPPPEQPPPAAQQSEHQGITGDDVVDSIDNFFKLS